MKYIYTRDLSTLLTCKEFFVIIKSNDKNTRLTENAIRTMMHCGDIPTISVGKRKKLIKVSEALSICGYAPSESPVDLSVY